MLKGEGRRKKICQKEKGMGRGIEGYGMRGGRRGERWENWKDKRGNRVESGKK